MFKPLLRTLPTLSGNLKLACNLLDYTESTNDDNEKVYETNIRYAKLYPISSVSWNKKIDAGLLGSSWEYDVKKFYDTYGDVFYQDGFEYNKSEMLLLDKSSNIKTRNTDFEYGVKRISYSKHGNQFACFAPIYVDDVDDIPAFFMLDVKFNNGAYVITKHIKINIGNNGDNKYNYLTNYLKKYVSQLDNKVVFCLPNSKQAAYYGIDIQHGGFAKCIDNAVSILYTNQNTLQNFDAMLCNGFKRNKLIMKQIIPLAFYFNLSDILNDREKFHYKNSQVDFSGYYYTSEGDKVDFYDFSFDYDEHISPVLKMHKEYGTMTYQNGDIDNIMDVAFPSLNEGRYINYQFSNKLAPVFSRWKMLYSDDEHPYEMNMSWAYSKNQTSNYRYGEFPTTFYQITGLADYVKLDGEYQYNMHLPLSIDKEKIYDIYDSTLAQNYESIFNNYCLNWFNIIHKYSEDIFENKSLWRDVQNDCVYYNGILYDMKNIYNLIDGEKIDKFGVFVVPDLDILTWPELANLKFTNFTLLREATSNVGNANAIANDNLLYSGLVEHNPANFLYEHEEWNPDKQYKDELQLDKIFTYAYADGNYIDISEVGIDYYEVNKYFDAKEITSTIDTVKTSVEADKTGTNVNKKYLSDMTLSYLDVLDNYNDYVINSYLQIPIFRASSLAYDNRVIEKDNKLCSTYIAGIWTAYYNGEIQPSGTKTSADVRDEWIRNTQLTYAHPADNSYILNMPECSEYIKKAAYYHVFDDVASRFVTSYYYDWGNNRGKFYYNGTYYAYMLAGDTKCISKLYGNTFYVSHQFFKSSDINDFRNPIAVENLRSYCEARGALERELYGSSYWKYDDILDANNYENNEPGYIYTAAICNPTAYSAYLYRELNKYKDKKVVTAMDNILAGKDLTQYVFNPIIQNNSSVYVSDVFTELSYNTGKFNGDNIPSKYVLNDKDVLWIDIYNLNPLYEKYLKGKTYPKFNEFTTHNFYANFLNKIHIYYYYIELFRNADYEYGDGEQHKLIMSDTVGVQDSLLLQREGEYEDGGHFRIEGNVSYEEWFSKDWYGTIFIKRKKLIDRGDSESSKLSHPVVRYVYENIKTGKDFDSFIEWYSIIEFDSQNNVFYYKDNPEDVFELVFKRTFFRVDSDIWDISNMEEIIASEQGLDSYKDLYFYRIQKPEEWDTKFNGISFIGYINDINKINPKDEIGELDSCLIPMFDSIFAQNVDESEIFTHVQLHNISITWNEHEQTNNYRYNANSKMIMLEVTDKEKEQYNLTKTYYNYSNTYAELLGDVKDGNKCVCDDLGYGKLYLNTKVANDGTKYGFYIINAKINNTSDSFSINGIVGTDIVNKIKYIYYINEVNIYNNQEYLKSIFKQVIPFTRLKILDVMQNANTIIYPNTYNIDLWYAQNLYNNDNESNEVDIKRRKKLIKQISLQRYMHDITPLLVKTTSIPHQYNLKLKDVKGNLLNTGKYNSIGDSAIYSVSNYINTFRPYRVYSKSFDTNVKNYNNVVDNYIPVEYKHYNCSRMVYLDELIEIKPSKLYTYDQLLEAQSVETTFELFKNHINRTRNSKWDDTSLLFLLNKYKVEYDTTPVGLNIGKTDKVFTLTYRFKLL